MILIGYKMDNISQEKNVINQKYSLEIEASKNASDLWSILILRNQIFSDICNSLHILLYPEVIFFRTECEIQERIRAVIANLRFLRCDFSLLHSGRKLKILFKHHNALFPSYNIKAWFNMQSNVAFRLQMTKTKQLMKK